MKDSQSIYLHYILWHKCVFIIHWGNFFPKESTVTKRECMWKGLIGNKKERSKQLIESFENSVWAIAVFIVKTKS